MTEIRSSMMWRIPPIYASWVVVVVVVAVVAKEEEAAATTTTTTTLVRRPFVPGGRVFASYPRCGRVRSGITP